MNNIHMSNPEEEFVISDTHELEERMEYNKYGRQACQSALKVLRMKVFAAVREFNIQLRRHGDYFNKEGSKEVAKEILDKGKERIGERVD
jgi:hypothetical protein